LQCSLILKHRGLFEKIISFADNGNEETIYGWEQIISLGRELAKEQPDRYRQLAQDVRDDDLATIIYTSGSTGVPKGVELTHKNLISLVHSEAFYWDPRIDRYLCVLPLAHVFGRSLNLLMIGWGVSIYYWNDLKNVGAIFREIQPTVTVVVPRLLEKIYAKMLINIHQASFIKRKIGLWAFNLAGTKKKTFLQRLLYPLADKLVFSALRKSLGNKLRIVICGGAALDSQICRFFIEIGVPIYEGWGLTEAATVTVNKPGQTKIGSVGPPLPPMELKISEEGEVLVNGPIVMQGYHLNPEATAKVIDSEGWLHTGDRGSIDSDGFLTILGRIKDLYKTSTGEYIAPVPIEQALCKTPLIDMAMVVGDGRKFASCLLFPNLEVVESLKASHKQTHVSTEEFLNREFIQQEMEKLLNTINTHLNHWEQIHAYRFVLDAPTIESGMLTPSMKIRREVVATKYKELIDSMYSEENL